MPDNFEHVLTVFLREPTRVQFFRFNTPAAAETVSRWLIDRGVKTLVTPDDVPYGGDDHAA